MRDQFSIDQSYFYINTIKLTDKERFALILDYFAKIRILVQEDVESHGKAVQEMNPGDKIKIGRQLKRMRQSYDLIKDLDEMVEGYKKGGASF